MPDASEARIAVATIGHAKAIRKKERAVTSLAVGGRAAAAGFSVFTKGVEVG